MITPEKIRKSKKSKTALIHNVNERKLSKHRRHRVNKDKLYQDWRCWAYGAAGVFLASEYAKRRTFKEWERLYDERLKKDTFYRLCLMRQYLAVNQYDTFNLKDFCLDCFNKGLLTKSYVSSYAHVKRYIIDPLFNKGYFLNCPVRGIYSLNERARLLFKIYEQYIKEYYDQSSILPTKV